MFFSQKVLLIPILILSIYLNSSCENNQNGTNIVLNSTNSVQKDLSPYGLPLVFSVASNNNLLSNFKTQVFSEIDGFEWKVKKGEDFQFSIEEIGLDNQTFIDKKNAYLAIPYFSNQLIIDQDDLLIIGWNDDVENARFLIFRTIESKGIYYLIQTTEQGVGKSLYEDMKATIESVKEK